MAASERVVIVDAENRVLGEATRAEMRARLLWHRAAYIFVFDSAGQLYVQLRTLTKDVFPGYWDLAAGGVVLAGESYEESAARELEEELGIRGVPLRYWFDFSFDEGAAPVWGRAFHCIWDGALRLQAEEVLAVKRMDPGAILEGRLDHLHRFTPDSLAALRRWWTGGGRVK